MKSEFKKIAIICASERELAPFLPLIEKPDNFRTGNAAHSRGQAERV